MVTPASSDLSLLSAQMVFMNRAPETLVTLMEVDFQVHVFGNIRALKKLFRLGCPALILVDIWHEESFDLARQAVEYLRLGLANTDTRVLLHIKDDVYNDYAAWPKELQVSGVLNDKPENIRFNRVTIEREVENFLKIAYLREQHNQEVQLLIAVAKFSEMEESFGQVLHHFSACLGEVCASCLSMQISVKNELGTIEKYSQSDVISEEDLKNTFNLPTLSQCLLKVITEKKLQVSISSEEFDVRNIGQKINKDITGFLAFPIITYGRVVKILFYLISAEDMEKITVSRIDLITKAFNQLKVFLERSQAEQHLKKQYLRLKDTMARLKEAEENLVQKEKLASIGSFAAGIAHEVNNPLSYVISNVSSMDEYVEIILKLQDMHKDLMESIDSGNAELSGQLKQNITSFYDESDLAFVLSDMKSVVKDSKEGLSRVKDIIKDLQSFQKSVAMQSITDILENALKLLKFEIKDIKVIFVPCDNTSLTAGRDAIHQIATSLIKNSIYSLNKSAKNEKIIKINVGEKNSQIQIDFWDNGIGIDASIKDSIFDPFFTTKPQEDGRGMGLSTCYNILQGLGGSISIKSEAGEYACLSVLIPKSEAKP